MRDYEFERRRLGQLAWLLDNSIPLPGGRFRIGLDALLGLVPGIGDLIGVLISTYIVREAARLGAPRSMLIRMAFNVAVEGVIGIVPFAGDVFDAAWKANARNFALLESHFANPHRAARSSRWFVAGLIAAIIVLVILGAAMSYAVVRLIVQALSA
jgi:hypothetical protein